VIPSTLREQESDMKRKYAVGQLVWYEPNTGMRPPFFPPVDYPPGLAFVYKHIPWKTTSGNDIMMYEIITPAGERIIRGGEGLWPV